MKIAFIEIQNFRKLKSVRIDFDAETTMFVGANNSGKTSAVLALRIFLLNPTKLTIRDVSLANWARIEFVGRQWENGNDLDQSFDHLMPVLDVWLDVPIQEIQHVLHILPTINWAGGLLGVRLSFKVKDLAKLRAEYLAERKSVAAMTATVNGEGSVTLRVWPRSLTEFLERKLSTHVGIEAYCLDPLKLKDLEQGVATLQDLPTNAIPLEKSPFKALIRIDEIAAQRDFGEPDSEEAERFEGGAKRYKRRLSEQLRHYYDRHLDPTKTPSAQDLDALGALQKAEGTFEAKLRESFAEALVELEDLGYPGVNNPKISLTTQLRASDGLRHGSAVEYTVIDRVGEGQSPLRLPEHYTGLGYQNLISMVFMLMAFRDEWMRVGKANPTGNGDLTQIAPLHLVLVEEPEAHLHAQVQQVFVKKAYKLLRKRPELGASTNFSTQLVISTHSSHVAHEADFSSLRYFRRRRPNATSAAPLTTVANLSRVFGDENETRRFVKRYLKATHCDLFFADAVIFVEGQAERILVPHFIRHHYSRLNGRYITLLDLGGSHAHSFKELVEILGLTTLIIADLDAGSMVEVPRSSGGTTRVLKAARPQLGVGQKTSNPVLKTWHPALEEIDSLVRLEHHAHTKELDADCKLHVAFQKEVSVTRGNAATKVVPRTFEDALILANLSLLSDVESSGITNRVKGLVNSNLSGEALEDELFELLKKAEKAAFALDCCLTIEDGSKLIPPDYIHVGLTWLDESLVQQEAQTGGSK